MLHAASLLNALLDVTFRICYPIHADNTDDTGHIFLYSFTRTVASS
jgi:hypothetical protein